MFHLLVSFEGWPDGAGSISTDRIYIKPDEAPGNAFLSNGKLNIDKISKVPALLVNETGGRGLQFARIAYITSLAQGSRDTSIQYAVDSSIASISNEDIEAYSNHLGIGKLNLTHTHWQVCNGDIIKIFGSSRQ